MADRYFVSQPIHGDQATLGGSEAHHLAHVMRARAGTEVVLFDGTGAEFAARVEKVGRQEVVLSVGPRQEIDREPRLRLTLGVALPKGDRQRWLVEKTVELGVARLVPLTTSRGVAQPVANSLVRLERTALEAAKQCGRNRLLEIAPPQGWRDFVTAPPATARRWVAHPPAAAPAGTPPAADLRELVRQDDLSAEIWLAVGPEGGLTDEEVNESARAGWQTVGLGPRILRVETAAIALAACCLIGSD